MKTEKLMGIALGFISGVFLGCAVMLFKEASGENFAIFCAWAVALLIFTSIIGVLSGLVFKEIWPEGKKAALATLLLVLVGALVTMISILLLL